MINILGAIMIKVENVSFCYKNRKEKVLDGLNFSIQEGEIVAFVGKNGSGKSTIGRLIAGITKLKVGTITIDGFDVSDRKNRGILQEKVGIVFQNPENQIIFNNIYDELSFSLKNLDKAEKERRILQALKQVEMLEHKDEDLYTLSLGQKQRIMIAEILAKNPKYIILDEPTTMIDSQGKEKIYEIIQNLKKQGYTVICITNLADEILLADRTYILADGKIVQEIPKEDLVEQAKIFQKFGIQEPTLLKILLALKSEGIQIELRNYSITELVDGLKRRMRK